MRRYMLHVFVVSTSYINMYGKSIFPRHHLWLANILCFSDNGFAQIYWLMVAAISELFFSVSMTTTVTCLHLQQREGGKPSSFSLQQNAASLHLHLASHRQTLNKCKPAFLLPTVGTNVLRGGLSAFYKTIPLRCACIEKKCGSVCCYLTMAMTAAPAPARAQTNKWNVMLSYSQNTSWHALVFNISVPTFKLTLIWQFICSLYWFVGNRISIR